MDNTILLTYTHVNGYDTFGWFTSIDEIDNFIILEGVVKSLIECVDCSKSTEIELSELGK